MKKRLTYIFILIFAVLISFSVAREKVWAGDINGDEARVIAAASGTFTYNGKTYRAYSSYISQLYSYLAADDVDLSASQADKAISYIYSNVQSGVSSGYVYEVGATDESGSTSDTDSNNDNSNGNTDSGNTVNLDDWSPEDGVGTDGDGSSTSNGDKSNKSDDNDATKAAKELSDKEVEDMFQDIESEESSRRKHSHKPKATETDASIIMNEDKIVISNGDEETVISTDSHIIPEYAKSVLLIVSIAILVIDIVVAAILMIKKCMRFKQEGKRKPHRGHSARRRIRKTCRYILTATTAAAVVLIFVGIAFVAVFYNNSKIVQNIQSSGYFRYAYTEYLAKSTDDTTSKKLSYEEFMIEEKQALSKLETSDYTKDISIAPYIDSIQKDMKTSLVISMLLSLLAIIIAGVLNIFMDLRRDRGVKSIATSELIGTAITIILAIVVAVVHKFSKIFIEPDYLYNFLNDQIDWSTKILIIVGFFGAVIGMSLTGLYINMHRDKQ